MNYVDFFQKLESHNGNLIRVNMLYWLRNRPLTLSNLLILLESIPDKENWSNESITEKENNVIAWSATPEKWMGRTNGGFLAHVFIDEKTYWMWFHPDDVELIDP
jgi:hypothetical protein